MRLPIGVVLALAACLVFAGEPRPPNPAEVCEQTHQLMWVDWSARPWAGLGDLRALEETCRETDQWRAYRYRRGQLESFVGNHALALADFDQEDRREPSAFDLGGFEPRDAIGYILAVADIRQIVMVNERHHASPDRLLTLALLEPLAKMGFRYLALETLAHEDPINERGYPVGKSGYYTNDVVFAEVVRYAIELGYEIVAYEETPDQKRQEADRATRQVNRDTWQARNIVSRILDEDPDAKVLVHCGYAHLQEAKHERWTPMAYVLRQLTGVDPLTIDQTRLSERSAPAFEHPVRREAIRRGWLNDGPIVLLDADGALLQAGRASIDVNVLSPSTKYANGRPLWMAMGARRERTVVDVPECAASACIIEAKRPARPDEVHYDRFEANRVASAVLYLPPGVPIQVQSFGLDGQALAERSVCLRCEGESD